MIFVIELNTVWIKVGDARKVKILQVNKHRGPSFSKV